MAKHRFARLKRCALRHVLEDLDARVIALGGGAWTVPANRTLVSLHDCLSVWLDAPFELCWQRIARNDEFVQWPLILRLRKGVSKHGGRTMLWLSNESLLAESDRAKKNRRTNPETIVKGFSVRLYPLEFDSGHEPAPIVLWYET